MAKPTVAWRARTGNQDACTSPSTFWNGPARLKRRTTPRSSCGFHPETGAIDVPGDRAKWGKGGPIRKIRLGTHTY